MNNSSKDEDIYNIFVKRAKRYDGQIESNTICLGQYTSLDKVNIKNLAISLIESEVFSRGDASCEELDWEYVNKYSKIQLLTYITNHHEEVCKGEDCTLYGDYCWYNHIDCLSYHIIKTKLNGCCRFNSHTWVRGYREGNFTIKTENYIVEYYTFEDLVNYIETINYINDIFDIIESLDVNDCDEIILEYIEF